MSMSEIESTVRRAMKALGCVEDFTMSVYGDRVFVSVQGEYYGVWDMKRNTFVD